MKQRVLGLLEGEGQGVVTSAELRRLGVGPAVLRTMLRQRAGVGSARVLVPPLAMLGTASS